MSKNSKKVARILDKFHRWFDQLPTPVKILCVYVPLATILDQLGRDLLNIQVPDNIQLLGVSTKPYIDAFLLGLSNIVVWATINIRQIIKSTTVQ